MGGRVGGPARAKALSPGRRKEIASKAGLARVGSLSASARKKLAAGAAEARWAAARAIRTAADAPQAVRRLLKSYDPASLKWSDLDHRYAVVREVLLRGDDEANAWLGRVLGRNQVRALVRRYRGAGMNEPDRERLRNKLGLTIDDLPSRPYLGLQARRRG